MRAQSCDAPVLENSVAASDIRLMRVRLPEDQPLPKAGMFYMLRAWAADEPPLLSRPISVHRWDEASRELEFLYQVKGKGTEKLAALAEGETVSLTGPAGNGFPVEAARGKKVAVVGGGIGTAPLLQLVREVHPIAAQTDFLAGYRDEVYRIDAFEPFCSNIYVATDTGSFGKKGFVTELLGPEKYDVVFICGPEIMMKNTARMCLEAGVECYVSKEGVMACGLGACLGCTCRTEKGEPVCVCKDGPVFEGSVFYG